MMIDKYAVIKNAPLVASCGCVQLRPNESPDSGEKFIRKRINNAFFKKES